MKSFILGKIGEESARIYLKKKKYKILNCNYKTPLGEIDIIAKDKDYIVFVEVKTRSSKKFGLPCEAVNAFKQNKIRQNAMIYLKQNKQENEKIRFDIIEVCDSEINHLENAF